MELIMSEEKSKKNKVGETLGGLVVLIVIIFAISKCGGESDKCQSDSMALVMSQEMVKKFLKAPSSADFPLSESKVVIDKKSNEADKNRCYFKISANVDSQNSFGAMIRNRYNIEMIYDKTTDNWSYRNLNIQK